MTDRPMIRMRTYDVMAELDKTALPLICIEVHRYTRPEDGWAFHWLTPDPDGSEYPFDNVDGDFDFDRARIYKGRIEGWGDTEWAATPWTQLTEEGYQEIPWEDLPTNLRNYVNYYIVPLEWQRKLAVGDPEVIGLLKIWVKGNLPAA